jgi:hypothetical protein
MATKPKAPANKPKANPANASKPVAANKPAAASKQIVTSKPVVANKPSVATKSAVVVKPVVATKPTVSAPAAAKPAAKAVAKPVAKKATKKDDKKDHKKDDKKPKVEKIKMERDSFTMPKDEYAQIALLKARMTSMGNPVKKSELLRAGIKLLAAMSDNTLKTTMEKIPTIKTGRPKK